MVSDAAVRWQAPDLSGAPRAADRSARPSVEQLAEIEKAAREEGFARGKAEGYAQGEAEVRRIAAQLETVLHAFTRPLDELDAEVETTLGALAVRIAGALLGRAYQADPALLAELVQTALAQAGTQAREADIHLHPSDLELVRQQVGVPSSARLLADPTLRRGELRVHTELMRLDGTFAARLDSALAELHATPPEAP